MNMMYASPKYVFCVCIYSCTCRMSEASILILFLHHELKQMHVDSNFDTEIHVQMQINCQLKQAQRWKLLGPKRCLTHLGLFGLVKHTDFLLKFMHLLWTHERLWSIIGIYGNLLEGVHFRMRLLNSNTFYIGVHACFVEICLLRKRC